MKSLVQTSLIFVLALSPLATLAADRHVASPEQDDVFEASTNYQYDVSCGGSKKILSSAPKGTAVTLMAGTCTCQAPTIVLNIMMGSSARDLCLLNPGEDCLKDIPEGADVIIGITADEGSGTCKVSGRISP